jgi:hypothetical protein
MKLFGKAQLRSIYTPLSEAYRVIKLRTLAQRLNSTIGKGYDCHRVVSLGLGLKLSHNNLRASCSHALKGLLAINH